MFSSNFFKCLYAHACTCVYAIQYCSSSDVRVFTVWTTWIRLVNFNLILPPSLPPYSLFPWIGVEMIRDHPLFRGESLNDMHMRLIASASARVRLRSKLKAHLRVILRLLLRLIILHVALSPKNISKKRGRWWHWYGKKEWWEQRKKSENEKAKAKAGERGWIRSASSTRIPDIGN